MKTNIARLLFAAALAALALAGSLPPLPAAAAPAPGRTQHLTAPDQVPKGLASSDWASIRAAYEAGRHAFQPVADGWQARNPGQQWTTQFDRRGFLAQPPDGTWSWGLELQSYGLGEQQETLGERSPAAQAAGQRLTYQWDAAVQEWFINDPRGLEHGFTIQERPADAGSRRRQSAHSSSGNQRGPTSAATLPDTAPLTFTLAVRGTLTPRVTADGLGVEFQDAAGATVVHYSGLKVTDADGKVLPTHFVAERPARGVHAASVSESEATVKRAEARAPGDASPLIALVVDERAARYPITIDPIAQQAYLKASNTGVSDFFGGSVAVSGDTVVVGADGESSNATGVNGNQSDNSAPYSGAAYVFTLSSASPPFSLQPPTRSGTNLVIQFTSAAGYKYYLERSPAVVPTSWSVVSTNDGGGVITLQVPVNPAAPHEFFRVRKGVGSGY